MSLGIVTDLKKSFVAKLRHCKYKSSKITKFSTSKQ